MNLKILSALVSKLIIMVTRNTDFIEPPPTFLTLCVRMEYLYEFFFTKIVIYTFIIIICSKLRGTPAENQSSAI